MQTNEELLRDQGFNNEPNLKKAMELKKKLPTSGNFGKVTSMLCSELTQIMGDSKSN
jgi:hypothetical protein